MRYDILSKLIEYIEYSSESIDEDYLSELTDLSIGHVRRLFEAAVGQPMNKYRIRRRLSIMIENAIASNESLMKIDTYPYAEYKSFSRSFKNEFKISPSEYIKGHKVKLQEKFEANSINSRASLYNEEETIHLSKNNYVVFKVPDDWDSCNYITELYEERDLKDEIHNFHFVPAYNVDDAQNIFFNQYFVTTYDKNMMAYDLVDAIRYLELENHVILDQYGLEDGEKIIATYDECWEVLDGDKNGLHSVREMHISEELLYEQYDLENMNLESIKSLILESKRISIIVKPLIPVRSC